MSNNITTVSTEVIYCDGINCIMSQMKVLQYVLKVSDHLSSGGAGGIYGEF